MVVLLSIIDTLLVLEYLEMDDRYDIIRLIIIVLGRARISSAREYNS